MSASLLALDAPTLLSGAVAAVCLTAAPLFRSRQSILLTQIAAGIFFATHYVFLGLPVAAAANMLGTVQTGAALFSTRSVAMGRLGYALIGMMALVGLWFWQGPISGLSMGAMVLIALARMQTDARRLRGLLLAGGVLWILHDAAAGAWIALAADIGAALAGVAALLSLFVRVSFEWRTPMRGVAAA